MKTIFVITNDDYSNTPVEGTQEELQAQFDDLKNYYPHEWDVKLIRRIGADADALIDENTGHVVAVEKIS